MTQVDYYGRPCYEPPDERFQFEDGNLTLYSTDGQRFRVYKGPLFSQSTAFKNFVPRNDPMYTDFSSVDLRYVLEVFFGGLPRYVCTL